MGVTMAADDVLGLVYVAVAGAIFIAAFLAEILSLRRATRLDRGDYTGSNLGLAFAIAAIWPLAATLAIMCLLQMLIERTFAGLGQLAFAISRLGCDR
jgi:hypothetical protein